MSEPFDAVDMIRTKRDKERPSDAQIDWIVDAYTGGVVADEQTSALAVAILLDGMERDDDIAGWTNAMIASGERMAFASLDDAPLPTAAHTQDVVADTDGVVTQMDALPVGVASRRLVAGRARKADPIQFGAGIELFVDPGERAGKGQQLMTLHTDTPKELDRAQESPAGGHTVDATAADGTGARGAVVLDRIG